MKLNKLLLVAALAGAAYLGLAPVMRTSTPPQTNARPASTQLQSGNASLENAYLSHARHQQIRGSGIVMKLLADDNDGSRHQRFLLRLNSGRTLLVSHNIDLAPRIESLQPGDTVEFNGEYEWNAKGGLVHWTHRDPQGQHVAGWLRHQQHTYQ